MTTTLVLGIDVGTTVVKVGVFDSSTGRCMDRASKRLPVRAYQDGRREIEAEVLLREVFRTVRKVREGLGGRWREISGIGLASQAGSTLILDRESGAFRSPLILWNDGRSNKELVDVQAMRPASFWKSRTLTPQAPAGLGRLRWLQTHARSIFRGSALHCGAGDFVYHALTGVWQQDAGSALQIGTYNARTQSLDGSMLDLIGLPLSLVAPLRNDAAAYPLIQTAARALELNDGLPVRGPYFDQESGYAAALPMCRQPLLASLGTAWVGNFALPQGFRGNSPTQIVVPHAYGGGELVVQPLFAGGVAWDWSLETFVDANASRAHRFAVRTFNQSLLPKSGILCLPWHAHAGGAGTYLNVSASTTRDDFVRATAASLVFEFGRVFGDVVRERVTDSIVLCGGASKAAYFRALFAATFPGTRVLTLADDEMAVARGAVHAFVRKHAGRRPPTPRTGSTRRHAAVQEAFSRYQEAFTHAFGNIPAGAAYRVIQTKATRR